MDRRRLARALALAALVLVTFLSVSGGPSVRDRIASSVAPSRVATIAAPDRTSSTTEARDTPPSAPDRVRTPPEVDPDAIAEVPRVLSYGDAGVLDAASTALLATRAVPSVSPASDQHVDTAIENTCAVDVELFWVDFEGAERSYGVLEAGVASALSTFRGHVWRARDLSGAEVRSFTAADESLTLCDDAHAPSRSAPVSRPLTPIAEATASARSIQRASLTIENTCAEPVAITWVHFDGTERPYGVLEAGDVRAQPTYEGHLWRARSSDGTLVTSLIASGDTRVALCTDGVSPDA